MKKLTVEQSFDFYLTSLERCTINLLDEVDEEIDYQIFEEFAIEYPATLSQYTLDVLEYNGIIDSNIVHLSKELQKGLLKIDCTSLWSIKSFKESSKWKEVLQLSDEIKNLIHQKWSEEELEYLRGNK